MWQQLKLQHQEALALDPFEVPGFALLLLALLPDRRLLALDITWPSSDLREGDICGSNFGIGGAEG